MENEINTPEGETMKERPILFSAPMVRAILAGRKTQTRRVIKPQPGHELSYHGMPGRKDCGYTRWYLMHGLAFIKEVKCPHGVPGDQLWVRETFQTVLGADGVYCCYGADYSPEEYEGLKPWKPSIHIFREHSRIDLRITNIRVERLQDISEDDAMAEGVEPLPTNSENIANHIALKTGVRHKPAFSFLWDEINGERSDCGWDANPWVWVIKFERVIK